MTITYEEYKTKGAELLERLAIIYSLKEEADLLIQSFDLEKALGGIDEDEDDEMSDEAYSLAYEIADVIGASFSGFGSRGGFWYPSTC